jgi:hypothetical protein
VVMELVSFDAKHERATMDINPLEGEW